MTCKYTIKMKPSIYNFCAIKLENIYSKLSYENLYIPSINCWTSNILAALNNTVSLWCV